MAFPNSLETIGLRAFSECGSLESVFLPSSLKQLGNYAFGSCQNLVSVTITANTSIGSGSFFNCSKLETVSYFSVSDPCGSVSNAFEGCSPSSVRVLKVYTNDSFCGLNELQSMCRISSNETIAGDWLVLCGSTVSDGFLYGNESDLKGLLKDYHAVILENGEVFALTDTTRVNHDVELLLCYFVTIEGIIYTTWIVKCGTPLEEGLVSNNWDVFYEQSSTS